MRRLPALVFVIFSAAAAAHAESARSLADEGNRLYQAGKLAEALQKYRQALAQAPGSAALHYNIGNVLYRQGVFDKAYDEYRQAFPSAERKLAQGARYNAGNTHFARNNWPEAVRSYQEALRLDPSDMDAKRNLELALLKMQEQKKQEQQKQDSKDDSQDQDQQQNPSRPKEEDRKQQDSPPPQPREQKTPGPQKEQVSREEAMRILDAMKEQDRPPKDPIKTPPPDKRPEKDW